MKFPEMTAVPVPENQDIDPAAIWQENSDRIQAAYLAWLDTPDDRHFEQFYHQILPALKSTLFRLKYSFPQVYEVNQEDALQYVWEQLLEALSRQRRDRIPVDSIVAFSRYLCKMKGISFFLSAQRRANRFPSSQISLGDDDKNLDLMEMLETGSHERSAAASSPDLLYSELERTIRKEFFGKILLLYCRTLFRYDGEPPRSLALFYARLYSHFSLELSVNSRSRAAAAPPAGSTGKTASRTEWALSVMKGKTVSYLMEESQKAASWFFSTAICWCEAMINQLLLPYPGIPDERKLGDLIYTEWFQKKQVSHWADDFHKTIYKKTARLIQEDPCMRSMLQAYCEDEHTTAMNLAHAAILKARGSKKALN